MTKAEKHKTPSGRSHYRDESWRRQLVKETEIAATRVSPIENRHDCQLHCSLESNDVSVILSRTILAAITCHFHWLLDICDKLALLTPIWANRTAKNNGNIVVLSISVIVIWISLRHVNISFFFFLQSFL